MIASWWILIWRISEFLEVKILNFPTNRKTAETSKRGQIPRDEAVAEIDDERLRSIPIVQQAIFFLRKAGTESGIKLTEKGFLGRKFVQAFWDELLSTPDEMRFRPTREFECPGATRIHSLLAEMKYVRKFKGAIRLTPKGIATVKSGTCCELYRDLLEAGTFRWSWGYEDRYPDFEFIQNSAPHLIERLMYWPTSTITAQQLFESVFGQKRSSTLQSVSETEASDSIFDPQEYMIRCLNVRFFERFCVPFGILRDLSEPRLIGEPTDPFGRTEFFVSDFSRILSDCK
jgi:hypothetical protein